LAKIRPAEQTKQGGKPRRRIMQKIAEVPAGELVARKGPTVQEKRFVDIYLASMGAIAPRDAAIEAGYTASNAYDTARKLLDPQRSPQVVLYLKQRQREWEQKTGTNFHRHMQDLLMIRDKAIEAGAWSAAVQAEVRRGMALGTIYIDRKEIRHGTLETMSKEELQRKLDDLKRLYAGQQQNTQTIDEPKLIEEINETRDEDVAEDEGEPQGLEDDEGREQRDAGFS
jgi:phage terminase small subunit